MKNSLVTLIVLITVIFSQGVRNGTSAASYLLVPQGAQYLSGGGAVANAEGLEAVFWNPAGLVKSENNVDAIFSHRSYIADIGINYFGVSMQRSGSTSLGVTIRTFNVGDIDVTDVYNTDGTGAKFTPTIFVANATYSHRLSTRTSVGVGVNYLYEGFERVYAKGLTFDIGVQYKSFLNFDNLDIGVALRNFGNPMAYEGSGLFVSAEASDSDRKTDWYKVATAAFDMPFIMDIGFTYKLQENINLGVTYQESNYGPNLMKVFGSYDLGFGSARFGYVRSEQQSDLDNIFSGISLGGTLDLSQFLGQNVYLDYAYIPTDFFSANQVFAIRIGL